MGVHRLRKQHSAPSLGGGGSGSGSGSSGSSGSSSMPPKGCMAVRVVGPAGVGGGREDVEDGERFVVPVGYLKHPLFVALLKAAEDEYGFEQKGAITIPCGVDHFRRVQGIIHHQRNHHASHHGGVFASFSGGGSTGGGGGGSHHGGGHHGSSHHHFHIAGCFRA